MSEWAKELLADVAREVFSESLNSPELIQKTIPAVLERRLLPLLNAGEAMRDGVIGGSGGLKRIQLANEYDAAKTAAMKEPG